MIRYYFDIRDDTGIYPDEEGMEFATQREAEVEAAKSLAGLARDLATLDDRPDLSVEVRPSLDAYSKPLSFSTEARRSSNCAAAGGVARCRFLVCSQLPSLRSAAPP
ncbi:hypothetical protein ACVWY5_005068 [Bradyrhizobium sp. USDA 3256]